MQRIVIDPPPLPPDVILHIRQPNWPKFRFEWHPATKRVYYVHDRSPNVGRLLAMHIDSDGAAQNAVLIFLRGYQEARDGREYLATEAAA
jgi:hypothetical protein